MDSKLLNQPLRLSDGSLLRNRPAKAPMSGTLGTCDNRPTAALVAVSHRWGNSDLKPIVTANVMIDRRALGEPGR